MNVGVLAIAQSGRDVHCNSKDGAPSELHGASVLAVVAYT
jgi:hypothetical protein